jgi:hypothetical protein
MPRIGDEHGMNVISATDKDGELYDDLLVVLTKDAPKVIELINSGAFDTKYEKPRAKPAPAEYYDEVDLDVALEDLNWFEQSRRDNP